MKGSLRRRLSFWHTGLFAAALAGRLALDWRDIRSAVADGQHINWRYLLENLAVSTIPLITLAIVTRWLIFRALQRITSLANAAERIHEGSLHESSLPPSGRGADTGDELDRLTSVLNEMTQRLDASFQRIREFTLHASHELKTPLTILRSGFERALTHDLPLAEMRDRLASWMDEVERLNRIVSGLTFLTQADARQIEMEMEPLDLEELLTDTVSEADILGQQLKLHTRLDIRQPAVVRGHRHRLRQVLLNLTDNAVKYNIPDGEFVMSLSAEGPTAVIRVSNTGPGIPAAEIPLMFERFYRSQASRGSGTEGCGLGLSIARWIVEAHHGTLTAESSGKWTTLTVRLPLVTVS